MRGEEIESEVVKKAARREKKKRPRVRMHGKRTREIPRLWQQKSGKR